jgi:hypothetical protein
MNDNDKDELHQLTRAEAAQMIRRAPAGAEFVVSLEIKATLVAGGTQTVHTYVDISRAEAVRLALRMFRDDVEHAGARVPLRVSRYAHRANPCYWLG